MFELRNGGTMKIILIALDTLRTDHLGTYGYSMETSPFIDRLSTGLFDATATLFPKPLPGLENLLT